MRFSSYGPCAALWRVCSLNIAVPESLIVDEYCEEIIYADLTLWGMLNISVWTSLWRRKRHPRCVAWRRRLLYFCLFGTLRSLSVKLYTQCNMQLFAWYSLSRETTNHSAFSRCSVYKLWMTTSTVSLTLMSHQVYSDSKVFIIISLRLPFVASACHADRSIHCRIVKG